jgi:hypothetical protein
LRPLDPACAIAAGNDRRAIARRGFSTPRELHVPSVMFVAYRAVDQSMAERALLESN